MKCLLLREYDVYAHNLHDEIADFKLYLQYGPSATMLGPWGHHPNRCIYLVPDSHKQYIFWQLKGIGVPHEFNDEVARANGWI